MIIRTRSDRKSTRLNSSHLGISYAVFCLKKKIIALVARLRLGLAGAWRGRDPFLLAGERALARLLLAALLLQPLLLLYQPRRAVYLVGTRVYSRSQPVPLPTTYGCGVTLRIGQRYPLKWPSTQCNASASMCLLGSSSYSRSVCARSSRFFFNDPGSPEIYTLSLHDALPI